MDNPSSEEEAAKLVAEANNALFGCDKVPSSTDTTSTTIQNEPKPNLVENEIMAKQAIPSEPPSQISEDIADSEPNDSDLSDTEEIDDYPSLNDSYDNEMEKKSLGSNLKRKRKILLEHPSGNNNNNNINDLKKLKSMDLIEDSDELDKESDNLLTILDQSVSQLAAFTKDDDDGDDELMNEEIDDNFDISEKLREMGEISVKPIKSSKSTTGGDESIDDFKTNSNSNDESDDKRKITNLRKNIREVMDDNQLDASTLAAQRQELERLARVQEQQKIIREVQRQIALERQNNKTQTRVMSLLQGHTSLLKNNSSAGPSAMLSAATSKVTLPGSSTSVLTKLSSTDIKSRGIKFSDNLRQLKSNLTPSVSIAPVKGPIVKRDTSFKIDDDILSHPLSPCDDEDTEDDDDDDVEPIDDDIQSKKDVVTIVDSSDDDCIVLSDDEEIEEEEDDPQNSGLHVNDAYNVPNENGNVVINIGHPESESSIFVAPQIARIIKPHQIGGVRFLFDNVIESIDRFDSSTGFGCILAHSMGLGKTLQLVCFCDIFLRHTSSKTVLCIMPINTLQNWLAEFNMWLPEDPEKSPLRAHGEVRPRNFKLFVLNDSHKTLNARSKVVLEWAKEGGVLLIGYEMYRLLSLKKMTKKKKKSKKFDNTEKEAEQTDEQKQVWDEIHTALVKPGPDLVICDEGHRIKNSHASISVALKQIRSKRRIVLTGYPLQNNLQEYWCMVDFVRPNYLGTKSEFSNMFERPIQNGQCIDSTPQDIKLMRYRAHVLHSLLLGFVQRRSHAVLQSSLPQKEEYVLLVRMTTFQRKLYDVFMNEVVRKKAVPNPLKAFAVCCKIWNHPDVLYNFLKKREADLDLELEEGEVVAGAATTGKSPAGKGKNKNSPKKSAGRKSKIFDGAEKNNKPAATISPSTGVGGVNKNSEIIPKQEIKLEKVEESTPPKIENLNTSGDFIKQEPKTDVNMNNSNASDTSMSSSPYPSSNYSSGYGSQGSYENYNPYSTPQHNIYNNDPYGSYGSTPNTPQNNYNYGNYGGYNQNDYWQNQNYYNQNYNHNYNQHYDNNYYQPNYNDQRYSQQYQSNSNDNQQNWNQNQQQMHQPQQQPLQSQQHKTQTPPESKSQEIVDLDTKEIKLEVRKEEVEPTEKEPEIDLSIKNSLNKSEDATVNEEISSLKLDESKSDEPDKDLLTKLITSPTKDDGIPYDWAVELMKGYIPDLIENSPKMEVFLCILDESLRLGDRMLVFSQSLLTLNLIEKFLQAQKIPGTESFWIKNVNYYRLDGSTAAIEREKLINEFNSNPNIHLFLVSTRAGSLGINLVGANRVIVFDASWNPCHDTQAVCRVYRYGQKKPCFVYRLVMDNCLEKRIYDRQVNKQGMSDRVVDECNPDAHLSLKEVTNLCWDDEEETEIKDFNDSKDKYIDIVMQKVIEMHSKGLSKEPFQHESLLVDRKEKKLSSAEKRLAQRGYELEKQAATRPSYIYNPGMSTSYRAIRTQDGSIVHRPVASVRPMQADMNSDKNNVAARPGGARPTRWIPAEVWQRQGMSAQEMTLPLDVVIPTSSAEKANIVLKAGQKVMVLKSPKGIYMQLETGKIIAIRTAFKMGQTNKDKITPSKPNATINKNSVSNIPQNLKNNSSITVVPAKSNAQGIRTGVMQTMMKNRNLGMNKNIQLGTARPYNMKQNIKSQFSSFMSRTTTAKDADDSSTNSSDKLYDGEVNDLSKDDDDDVDLSNLCDDDIEELKSDDDDDVEAVKTIKILDSDNKMDVEIEPKVDATVESEPTVLPIAPSKDETPPTPTQVVQESITCNNSNSNTNSNSNSGDNTNNNSNSNNSGSNGGNNGSNNNNYSNNGNGNSSTPNNNGGNGGNNNGGNNNNNNNNNNNPNNNNNNNNNNSNGNDNNNENSENSNENPANTNQNNGTNTPGSNEMKSGSMQVENDDVIMVSSSQNFPPKTIDSYSIPSCYGMTYGNYPPYYHQSYSYMNPHMQQQQQYYNYPMQSGMHPASQYHGQMSNMASNPYMSNHMHSNPHGKSYHHNVANSHAESNQMQSHVMQMNSSANNQYNNSSGNNQHNSSSSASNNSAQNASHNAAASKQNNSNYGHFSHNPSNNSPNTTASAVIPPSSATQSYTTSSTSTTTTQSQATPSPFLSNISSNIPPINHHNSMIPPPSSDISSFPPMPSSNNVISNIQPPQPPIPSQSNMSSSLSGNIFPSYTTANISSSGPTSTSQQSANSTQYTGQIPNSSSSMYSHPTSNSTNTLPHYSTSKASGNHMSISTSSSGISTNTPTSMSSGSNNAPASVAGSNASISPYSYSGSNMSLIPPPSFANLPPNAPGSNFPGFQSHSSNQTTMPSQSTTPTSSSSYSSSQFPPFPPHSSSYLSSLQFPPHSSFSPLSHPFGGGGGYSQSSSVSSTPPSNYGQSSMQQSGHMQQYPYHSQPSQTPPQITHSVTSMTNQLTPSTSSNTPVISNQIPHSGSSPQMNQSHQQPSYNSSVTTPSQTQTKPIVSATVSTPIMIDDDMEPAPIRDKMIYKQQNMIERKGSRNNQNDMIDPYMQQHQHQSSQPPPHPNMYHEMYATQKTSKNSLKNYRHNKMSARQMPPTAVNDGGMESPHTPQNPHVNSPGPINSNYPMASQQIQPPSSIPTSVSPQNLNYQPNMYPIYDTMPPQNRHHGGGPKSYHTPSPHSYHSSVASPSQMSGPVGPNVGGGTVGPASGGPQPPKIESSLSFLEKTASAINDDKNGFQASLSNITRSYSPSPNPNYNDMMPSSKSSPATTTTMKPKRQNKTTKKEKAKLKAAMMTNIEPPQKPKTPNMQNIPTGPYSSGSMVPGGGVGGAAPGGPPFMNTTESIFQNIPTTLSGPLFSSSFSYGGYNTVPSSIPPPIINDQMNQAALPTTTSSQHFSSPYGGYLPQYAPTTIPSNTSTAQSSNVTTPATMSPAPATTTTTTSSVNTTGGGYSSNSNIPTTSSISNLIPTNTTSNYDQSIPSPQVSGSAFHRPDVSAYASPYLPPGAGPDPMAASVPSYVPPSGPYSSSGNGYGSSSGIPPPIPPYQPGGYGSQFPQNLPPPSVSTTPAYPPYGYSPAPYGVASQYGGPPPSTYPPLGSAGGMPVSYDPQRISSVPNSEQYPGYTPSYSNFPPYAPQSDFILNPVQFSFPVATE